MSNIVHQQSRFNNRIIGTFESKNRDTYIGLHREPLKLRKRMSWISDITRRCQLIIIRLEVFQRASIHRHSSLQGTEKCKKCNNCWLVVSTYPSEKWWSSSIGMMIIPNFSWKVIKLYKIPWFQSPPTRHVMCALNQLTASWTFWDWPRPWGTEPPEILRRSDWLRSIR